MSERRSHPHFDDGDTLDWQTSLDMGQAGRALVERDYSLERARRQYSELQAELGAVTRIGRSRTLDPRPTEEVPGSLAETKA